jgi:hypothetical protein
MPVTFDETPLAVVNDHHTPGGLAGMLIRHHIVATLSQAQMVLIIIALLILSAAGIFGRTALKGDTIDTRKNFVPAVSTTGH